MAEYYDAAVSGADPITSRPGFAAMLERITGNGVRTIIVETASRFARDLMVQEVGYSHLRDQGIELIAADSPQSFVDDTPTARLIRQVLGAIAEFDKAMTVAKLKGARDRKSAAAGRRIEGRKSHAVSNPEAVAMVKRLRAASSGEPSTQPASSSARSCSSDRMTSAAAIRSPCMSPSRRGFEMKMRKLGQHPLGKGSLECRQRPS